MNSQASASQNRFARTRWSIVMLQAGQESTDARDALSELAQRYQYPVYAYIRRSGHPPALAVDLTRSAVRWLLRPDSPKREPTTAGHYRHFLLERLQSFLRGKWSEVAEDDSPALDVATPPDLEARYERDQFAGTSPEQAFQRCFALVVLRRSLQRLRNEAAQTGHLDMYDALEPYLARDPPPGQYEPIGARLRIRHVTLVLALKRLRQRLRELAAEELSDTVNTADNLASEQEALLAVLGELSS
jgi:RNA polymerase sigma-70 factor (ECF subfamily)